MNLARLNHILIPKGHREREKWRTSRPGRILRPVWWFYNALSDEGRVLAVLLLFVGAAGLETERTEVYILWSALLGVLLGALAVRRLVRLKAVSIALSHPPRVSVGQPITFSLSVRNHGDRPVGNLRLRGPFLTWDGTWRGSPSGVSELAPDAAAARDLRATFVERGEHTLDPFEVVALTPLGLAVSHRIRSRPCQFRVVPPVASVERIDLPSGRTHQPGGVAQASQTGDARELFGVRPYRPGDSVRDLHVRTWARVGVPHVKVYQEEFFTRIGVILDTDRTVSSEARFEAAISLAAGVIHHLSGGEALIDVLVVGGQTHVFTLGRSLGFFERALDLLSEVRPSPPLSVDELMAQLAPYLDRLSAVVLITEARDELRDALRARIDRFGVACRTLRVSDRQPGPPPAPGEVVVKVEDIVGLGSLQL